MKINKQKIENIKNKLLNITGKFKNRNKTKIPKKYYILLIFMLALGSMTLFKNVNKYKTSNNEEYIQYTLEETKKIISNDIEVRDYIIDQSSINTNIAKYEELIETISYNGEEENNEYIMPIQGEIIKEFAIEKLVYSETLGMWKTHPGIDIKSELGEEIKSASDGKVIDVQSDSFYGNTIKIQDSAGYIFIYSNINTNLEEGDVVKKGDVIGKIDISSKGELADDTHLHFEIIKDEKQMNPLDVIPHE